MILVTGATGTVGSEVVKQLSAAGASVRALVHNPQRAAFIEGPNVEIAHGDFDSIASLDAAVSGVDHVFVLTPSGPQQIEAEGGLLEAAARAGVRHVVKLSVIGASLLSPIHINRWHWMLEQKAEDLGLQLTAVRPTMFMQNLLGFAGPIIHDGKFYVPGGSAKVSLIDTRDVASVAVAALTQIGHEGRTYELTGPEAVSYGQVAEALSSAIGKPVTYVDVPPEAARSSMLGTGMPEWQVDGVLGYFDFFRKGVGEVVTPHVERITGRPAHTIQDFTRDYAVAFKGG